MGKTTFAVNMIENAMLNNGIIGPAVMFRWRWATRFGRTPISSVGGIYRETCGRRTWGQRLAETGTRQLLPKMREWPIYIDETPMMNIMRRCGRNDDSQGHDGKIGVVLVDYSVDAGCGKDDRPSARLLNLRWGLNRCRGSIVRLWRCRN